MMARRSKALPFTSLVGLSVLAVAAALATSSTPVAVYWVWPSATAAAASKVARCTSMLAGYLHQTDRIDLVETCSRRSRRWSFAHLVGQGRLIYLQIKHIVLRR